MMKYPLYCLFNVVKLSYFKINQLFNNKKYIKTLVGYTFLVGVGVLFEGGGVIKFD